MVAPSLPLLARMLRLLPSEMPGKARLARLLLRAHLDARDVYLRDRYGCTLCVPSLREPVGFHLLVNATYERSAVELVLARLRPGSVFVDVGANVGTFALPAARRAGSRGLVLAVEPSPIIRSYLARNVALNGLENVRLDGVNK